jgi:hypothetical protein
MVADADVIPDANIAAQSNRPQKRITPSPLSLAPRYRWGAITDIVILDEFYAQLGDGVKV